MLSVGQLKAIIDRQRNYFSYINFAMLGYLFLDRVGFRWWYLLLIPAGLVWTWIDLKWIMPRELGYLHGKSPVFRELLDK